jgi:hypothetical protein
MEWTVVNPISKSVILGECPLLGKNMVEANKSGKPGNLEFHTLEILGV